MDVRVRALRPDDVGEVLALRELAFEGLRREREVVRWRWEFDENPARRPGEPDGFVLERGGRIVGNFGGIPYRVKIGSGTYRARNGIDLCVHPELQGRGLARLLGDAFLDPAWSEFPFVSAPVPATTHLFVSRGGVEVGGAGEPLAWIYHAAPGRTGPEPPGRPAGALHVAPFETFDARFDRLWERLAPERPLMLVRDAAALGWRYSDYPFGAAPQLLAASDAAGELRGFAVVQRDPAHDRLYVLEHFTARDDEPAMAALLHRCCVEADGSGLSQLAYANRGQASPALLAAHGFQALGGAIPSFAAKVQGRAAASGVATARWEPTLGDGDMLFGVGDLR